MRTFVRDLIGILVLAAIILVLLRLVVGTYSVVSQAMEPGLRVGESLLVNKLAYRIGEPSRGDIVHYVSTDGSSSGMKRIIGLPGDYIEIRNGAVYVNGVRLNEPYARNTPNFELMAYQVPPGYFFLMSDNRSLDFDSSENWIVHRDDIIGRAWVYTWPPDRWGKVENYPLNIQIVAADTP